MKMNQNAFGGRTMTMKIKKPLAVIATVVLTLMFAVSTAVPAFAAEADTSSQNNEQFEIVDPKYEGDTNNYVMLPDAPAKEGYTFKGWSVDGGTELHSAGESIVNNDGHKMQLQPVYEAKVVAPVTTSAPVAEPKNTPSTQHSSTSVVNQSKSSSAGKEALGAIIFGIVFGIISIGIACVVVLLPLYLLLDIRNGRLPYNSTVEGLVGAVLLLSPVIVGLLIPYEDIFAQNITTAICSAFR